MTLSLHHIIARLSLALVAVVAPLCANAQWTDHFSYSGTTLAAVVDGKPVCGNSYALFYYADGYIGRLNKLNHLSSVGISALASSGSSLVVGYSDGGIDIVDMESFTTVNIPELKLSEAIANNNVNNICVADGIAYVATGGGVAELNIAKEEFRSFWRIAKGGVSVNEVCVSGGRIYAGTTTGVYTAPLSSRLLEDYSQWTLLESPTGNVASIAAFDGAVYAAIGTVGQNCPVWKITSDLAANQVFTSANYFRRLTATTDRLIVTQGAKISVLGKDLKEVAAVTNVKSATDVERADVVSNPSFRSAHLLDNETLAIAERDSGLVITNLKSVGKSIKPGGPVSNALTDMMCAGDVMYFSGEGRYDNFSRQNLKTSFSVLKDDAWATETASSYSYGREPVFFAQDPVSGQVYLTTWGSGVFMIDDYKFGKKLYTNNSALQAAHSDVVYTDAIAVDDDQNVVIVNAMVMAGLKIMDKDSTWYSYSYGPMSNCTSNVCMVSTSNGNLWLCSSQMNTTYLCVFNINGTPETDDDDLYMTSAGGKSSDPQYVGSFSLVDASSGEQVGTRPTAVAESADGSIWVGTTAGILVTTDNATMLQTGSVTFNRIKVPRNDGTNLADYLVDGQYIYDIKVDGADRKWIATDNGVYLVSSDGLTTIHHFTAENSPLPSNTVTKLCVRKSDGEVFMMTGGGLVSRRGDAIAPATKLSKIKIFPNPISATGLTGVDYVTMTGFEMSSPIFITDVAGNRIYRTTSLGGMARWDMRREGGGRVANGVYIVWATNADGSTSAVGKILVTE